MKRHLEKYYVVLSFAISITLLFLSSSASANPYFGIQAGMVSLEDSKITVPGVGSADVSSDTGLSIGIKLGSSFTNFRIEGELDYKTNDLDTLSGPGGSLRLDGDVTSTSLMFNGYYDIKASPTVVPYLGLGLGFSRVALDADVLGVNIADDEDIVFAYQFLAGIGFSASPTVTIDVGYKYFATADPSFEDVTGFPFDGEYSSHNITIGARFKF